MASVVDQLSSAGSRALGMLLSKTKNNYDLGYHSFSTMFNNLVNSVTDYCSGVWAHNTNCKKIDSVMERGIRFYLGLPRTAAISWYMGDMAWTPGIVRRDIEMILLYNQLIKMPLDRLTRMVFENEKVTMRPGGWCKSMYRLCHSLSLEENWENNQLISTGMAREKLMLMYQSAWRDDCNSKTKLQHYRVIHSDYKQRILFVLVIR